MMVQQREFYEKVWVDSMFSIPWLVSPTFFCRNRACTSVFLRSRCSPFVFDIHYPVLHMSTSERNMVDNDMSEFCVLTEF